VGQGRYCDENSPHAVQKRAERSALVNECSMGERDVLRDRITLHVTTAQRWTSN
jgi:hypothetical protein